MTRVLFATQPLPNPNGAIGQAFRLLVNALAAKTGPEDHLESRVIQNGYAAPRGGIVGLTARFFRDRYDPGVVVHAFDESVAYRGVDAVHVHHLDLFTPELGWAVQRLRYFIGNRRTKVVTVWSEGVGRALQERHLVRRSTPIVIVPYPHLPVTPGHGPDRFDILWIGTSGPRKDFRSFISALAHPASGSGLRVAYICSETKDPMPIPASIVASASQRHALTRFPYPAPWDEVDRLYRTSRVVVSTSKVEGYQVVTADGLLRGCHLLLPGIEPFLGTYRGEPNVRFYRAGNVENLAESLRETPSGAGGASGGFVEDHSPEKIGDLLWEMYRSIDSGAPVLPTDRHRLSGPPETGS